MKKYLRFIKLEHTLFSLPIVFAGTLLAWTLHPDMPAPSLAQILWILLAITGARSMGFGVNRIIDHKIDAANPRTQKREIPSGQISLAAAWAFVAVSSAVYVFAAAMLSPLCLMLSPVPLILFAIYPLLKRLTAFTHLGLGVAWGIAPIGGWIAVRPILVPFSDLYPVLLLAVFCIFWVAGFDIIYALLDEEHDRRNGIHSVPARLGQKNALVISELLHFAGFLALGTLVQVYLNSPLAFALLGATWLLLSTSHWKLVAKPVTPEAVEFSFFKVNAVTGFVVFFIVAA